MGALVPCIRWVCWRAAAAVNSSESISPARLVVVIGPLFGDGLARRETRFALPLLGSSLFLPAVHSRRGGSPSKSSTEDGGARECPSSSCRRACSPSSRREAAGAVPTAGEHTYNRRRERRERKTNARTILQHAIIVRLLKSHKCTCRKLFQAPLHYDLNNSPTSTGQKTSVLSQFHCVDCRHQGSPQI